MGKKKSISLDDELIKKLKKIQGNMIKDSKKHISFSFVINEYLRKVL